MQEKSFHEMQLVGLQRLDTTDIGHTFDFTMYVFETTISSDRSSSQLAVSEETSKLIL